MNNREPNRIRMLLRHMGAMALAAWIAGATSLVGEARTHETLNQHAAAAVTVRPVSPVVHLRWEANVHADGCAFRLFSGRKKAEMQLLGEVEARPGQHSYRFQQESPSAITVDCRLQHYELRFLTEDGDEVSLASITVIEENVTPETAVEVSSPRSVATLGSLPSLQEHQGRMPKVRRRTLGERGNRCPPTPPP
jgi:hypothetical protein